MLITEYRNATLATYGAIASELGISPSAVRQMEEGYLPKRGREEILSRLSKMLGKGVGALFTNQVEAKTA